MRCDERRVAIRELLELCPQRPLRRLCGRLRLLCRRLCRIGCRHALRLGGGGRVGLLRAQRSASHTSWHRGPIDHVQSISDRPDNLIA